MGVKGRDFVMVCSDTTSKMQILTIKEDEDRILPIDPYRVMALAGEPGDRMTFAQFIIANVRLYALRNSTELSTHAIANFTRMELATALRKGPYMTNLLIAGFDAKTGPSLFWLDYLATMHKMNFAGTGYGSMFSSSIFDRYWKPDLTEGEALNIMEMAIAEVKKRLVVAPSHYMIKVIDANGTRIVKTL